MENHQFRKLIDEQLIKKHAPAVLSSTGVAATLIMSNKMNTRMIAMLYAQGLATKAAYEKYVLSTRSNNWHKIHGYPLRRKKAR